MQNVYNFIQKGDYKKAKNIANWKYRKSNIKKEKASNNLINQMNELNSQISSEF